MKGSCAPATLEIYTRYGISSRAPKRIDVKQLEIEMLFIALYVCIWANIDGAIFYGAIFDTFLILSRYPSSYAGNVIRLSGIGSFSRRKIINPERRINC